MTATPYFRNFEAIPEINQKIPFTNPRFTHQMVLQSIVQYLKRPLLILKFVQSYLSNLILNLD